MTGSSPAEPAPPPVPEPVQEYVERDGARIGVQVYPDPAGDGPMAVLWPAMGVPARYYRRFAGSLLSHGFGVAVADLRGTGASTPVASRASTYGYAELAADVGAVLDALKPRCDGRRRLLLGHSLGGQACLLHLALTDADDVDALALIAVGLPYWRLYRGAFGRVVLPYSQGISATAALLGVWPGWGFGGRQARGVIRDWAHTARTGRFPRLGGADVETAVRGFTTPVLAVNVDGDRLTPAATVDHLCAKLAGAPVRRERYTSAQAGAPLDHFRWARAAGPLAARIADFAADPPARP